jgi:hypothetical protein
MFQIGKDAVFALRYSMLFTWFVVEIWTNQYVFQSFFSRKGWIHQHIFGSWITACMGNFGSRLQS